MKRELTSGERDFFEKIIRPLEESLSYPISDIFSTELFWDDKYNSNNGILGSFNWRNSFRISLNPIGKVTPELLLSTVVHELHHKWQFEKYNIFYVIALIPFLRKNFLEKSAFKVEAETDIIFGNSEYDDRVEVKT